MGERAASAERPTAHDALDPAQCSACLEYDRKVAALEGNPVAAERPSPPEPSEAAIEEAMSFANAAAASHTSTRGSDYSDREWARRFLRTAYLVDFPAGAARPPEPEGQDILSAADHLMEYADHISGPTERLAVVQLAKRLRAGAARPSEPEAMQLLADLQQEAEAMGYEQFARKLEAIRSDLSRGAARPPEPTEPSATDSADDKFYKLFRNFVEQLDQPLEGRVYRGLGAEHYRDLLRYIDRLRAAGAARPPEPTETQRIYGEALVKIANNPTFYGKDAGCEAALALCDGFLVRGAARSGAADPLREMRRIVDEQAQDEGLWLDARGAITEAYLQQALRTLHAAVERATGGETGPLSGGAPATKGGTE